MTIKIDAAYVIGLPRLGRLQAFFENFPPDSPIPVPEFLHGIDAQRVPLPGWWNDIPSMYGCNESHRLAIGLGLSRGYDCIAVFEDDARFVSGASELLPRFLEDVPSDWHGLMLGGQISCFDGSTQRVTDRISKCIQVERNHAYLMSRSGMEAFYACLCEPNSIPIDHRWGDLQEAGKINVYRCEPFIAYQAEGVSSISGRVEAARIWDDRVDVRIRRPEDVPVIALVCPFTILEQLRNRGIVSNGGESPPQVAVMNPGRVENGEKFIADTMLYTARNNPELFHYAVRQLRQDTSFHRTAALALWHPTELIPYPGAAQVRADTYDTAATAIRAISANNRVCGSGPTSSTASS